MSGPEREDKDQLWSEATLWFARMRSPDAEAFRAEFEQWLARGALHRRYYNRAAEYWVDSGTALSDGDVQNKSHGLQEARSEPRKGHGAVAALVAASVLVVGSTALLIADRRFETREPPADSTQAPLAISRFATTAAEERRVRLADRSIVSLGSDTILRVQLGSAMRRLELDRGQARFDVAHEARPFVVFAGGGSVTAHGTVFDVAFISGQRVSVRLIRGSVDIRLPVARNPAFRSPARRLKPGESISFAAMTGQESGVAPASPRPPGGPAQAEASSDYRDVRLADIVAEANHNAPVPIRFADPATGAKRVSGRFRTDDNVLLAERFAALFDLVADRSDPSQIVLRPR